MPVSRVEAYPNLFPRRKSLVRTNEVYFATTRAFFAVVHASFFQTTQEHGCNFVATLRMLMLALTASTQEEEV